MYRFFNGCPEDSEFICKVKATDPEFPYTEPQIGDFIDLPFDVNPIDRELWVIKNRIVYDDQIEFMCERYIPED